MDLLHGSFVTHASHVNIGNQPCVVDCLLSLMWMYRPFGWTTLSQMQHGSMHKSMPLPHEGMLSLIHVPQSCCRMYHVYQQYHLGIHTSYCATTTPSVWQSHALMWRCGMSKHHAFVFHAQSASVWHRSWERYTHNIMFERHDAVVKLMMYDCCAPMLAHTYN
jgi:hypothetical protein